MVRAKNLCCNRVEFSMELGFNSPTSYSILNFVICFGRLGCTLVNSFLSKKIEKMICITFVHICHVLKTEH